MFIWESLDPAHEHHETMTKAMNEIAIERLDAFLRESYVACLNMDYKVPLMWSHYANSHKGMCLKFNKDMLINDPMIISSGKVRYNNTPIDIFKALIKSDEIPFKEYFYKKSCDWEYEKEYRMISATRREVVTKENMYLDQHYNGEALEGIIFGANCGAKEMLSVIDDTEELNIKYSRVELSCTEYCCTDEIPVTKEQVRNVLERTQHKFS